MEMKMGFQERMLELGMLHLKHASKKMKDNEPFVKKAIEKYGIEELAHASDRLRSEGHFLLWLSSQYPTAVKYAKLPIYQRYKGQMGEEVAEVFNDFPFYLMDIEPQTFKHMPVEMASHFYNVACSSTGYYLSFYGDKKPVPQYGKHFIDQLDEWRPEIRKLAYEERMRGYAKAKAEAVKKRAELSKKEVPAKKPISKIAEEKVTPQTSDNGAENE